MSVHLCNVIIKLQIKFKITFTKITNKQLKIIRQEIIKSTIQKCSFFYHYCPTKINQYAKDY